MARLGLGHELGNGWFRMRRERELRGRKRENGPRLWAEVLGRDKARLGLVFFSCFLSRLNASLSIFLLFFSSFSNPYKMNKKYY